MYLNITDYKICQTDTLLQSERSSGFGNIPCPKWKRDWQGVRLTKHSWTISSSPSEMTMIFYPDSTLNPTKLRRLQVILFGAINDSTLLAKTFGTNQIFMSAQLVHIEHTAEYHVMRKRNFISTSICLSVCLNSFPEEFQIRGTDETLMAKTVPIIFCNDSFGVVTSGLKWESC